MNSPSYSPTNIKIATELVSSFIQIPDNINSFEFDTFEINENFILKNIAGHIFKSNLTEYKISIDHELLANFISLVADKYYQNPFHNFQHAINVLHMTSLLAKNTNIIYKLNPHIIFALLISALCHDVGHPGHTNSYEINSFGKYAKLYNDKSVLENHHCTTTFELLEQSGLIHCFKGDDFREFRKTIIHCILGTDMSKHQKSLQKLGLFDTFSPVLSVEQQYIICGILVHYADLSSSIKHFDIYFQWSKRISRELYEQSLKEELEGLPSLPFMKVYDNLTICINEINFITNICIPMWELFSNKFENMNFLLERCKENLEKWKELNSVLISNNYLDSLKY